MPGPQRAGREPVGCPRDPAPHPSQAGTRIRALNLRTDPGSGRRRPVRVGVGRSESIPRSRSESGRTLSCCLFMLASASLAARASSLDMPRYLSASPSSSDPSPAPAPRASRPRFVWSSCRLHTTGHTWCGLAAAPPPLAPPPAASAPCGGPRLKCGGEGAGRAEGDQQGGGMGGMSS